MTGHLLRVSCTRTGVDPKRETCGSHPTPQNRITEILADNNGANSRVPEYFFNTTRSVRHACSAGPLCLVVETCSGSKP